MGRSMSPALFTRHDLAISSQFRTMIEIVSSRANGGGRQAVLPGLREQRANRKDGDQ